MARSAKQFFLNARFDPGCPEVSDEAYRKAIHEVVTMSARRPPPESKMAIIPGFANLREFSAARPELLKGECGSAWESYFQKGHWRMVFPFSRRHQSKTAMRILDQLHSDWPVVIHVVRFPQLSINHALLAYAAEESGHLVRFSVYDPNQPEGPATLIYDRPSRTFLLSANKYFRGGRVDVYPVYHDWLH